jgi:hypothetical protein
MNVQEYAIAQKLIAKHRKQQKKSTEKKCTQHNIPLLQKIVNLSFLKLSAEFTFKRLSLLICIFSCTYIFRKKLTLCYLQVFGNVNVVRIL